MIRRSLLTLLFASVGLSVQGASAAAELTPVEARAIAKEAYVYGFPMEDSYRTMYAFSIAKGNPEYKGPFNSVLNIARVFTPDDKAFVTPNSDTPYTFLGLDLRTEPIVLTLPAIEKNRYYVFQMMDLYTYNFDYLGTRTTGNGGGKFLIAGPRWKGQVPKGITKVVRSETELVNVIGRTQLFNPADLDKVKKIQAGYKVEPLSAFVGKEAPKALAEPDWIKPLGAAEQRTSLEFFNVLNFALQFAPTHPSEKELRARFARIGVAPGKHIDVGALPADIQAAMQDGMADGQKAIDARRAELGGKIDTLFGTRAYMKNNNLDRAVGAQVGIGANSREEALYPIYEKDAAGQALDGSKARYVLRFAKGQLPPVNAFWSLTMYGLPDQLLVKNDQDRYLINSPMLPDLKTDADGGLTIYIQSESPGKDREANWLPAPQGPFMLTMRYYLPKPELLSGQWKSPVVRAAP
ncbi:DUF1254 domain-containing protein [Variovorax saccharolyticus]|uniref:DUF1254 domain-containing protein n=1 Tax=Variovorax saccharolyticus TaxID=3053516 RepID=UPI0025772981|nr:DUF1254 domain-containing protein [Variovorax sp. J22R187]MDM0019044.1 DUF1254 domain-containing protein [Variovorax sp. J22R187]